MELKYKLFPYPVLWEALDDYKTSNFKSDIQVNQSVNRIKISFSFENDNEGIKQYLNNGDVEYIAHIECPLTAYRTILCTSDQFIETEISETELNGKVSICTLIVAKKDISSYANDDFNDDYSGVSFQVAKGAILAVGTQMQFRVDKNTDELANLPSIFSIVKKETTERIGMQVELSSEKIRICLNITDFNNYQIINKMPNFISTIHSSLVFPALIFAFGQLKNSCDDYEDYRWYKSLVAIFKKNSMIFDNDLLQCKTSIELAQIILDMPSERTFKSLVDINNIEEDDI